MAGVEDILKSKKIKKGFVPEKRRAWDYLNNGSQTEHESGHKGDTKATTNGSQMVHKDITKGTQPEAERFTNSSQTVHQSVHKTVHERETNGSQIGFSELVGIQQKIVLALFKSCTLTGQNLTQKITLDYLASTANVNKKSLKTTMNRLKRKGVIIVAEYKDGRGGWTKYNLANNVYEDIVKSGAWEQGNGKQTVYKGHTEEGTEAVTTGSYSSSSNIKTTTTDLDDAWKNIDCTPLEDIGFCTEHLKQLMGRNTAEIVQQSIHHFAFYLETHQPGDPLKLFMGVLRKGQAWIETKYQSPQERALKAVLEAKREEQERVEKMEAELLEFNFSDWVSKLTEEQQRAIVNPVSLNLAPARKAELKKHFIENIYKK